MQSWCLGLLLVLVTPAAMAQSNWLGDVLVQRLPNGDAYAEVQLAWQSDASTASDSLTVTLVATRDSEILGFHKDKVLARPAVEDSVTLQHVHVRRIPVPSGSVSIEWNVTHSGGTLWLHNTDIRVPVGGLPEFSDAMVVSTHAPATAMSRPEMVHSGLDLIPQVGRSIPLNASSARFYTELHGVVDIVGQDSLFLFRYGWADADGQWDPSATKYARKKASVVVPLFEALPCTPSSPSPSSPVLKLEAQTREGQVIVQRDVRLGSRATDQQGAPATGSGGAGMASNALLSSLSDLESKDALIQHLEDHLALASTNEQNTIQQVLIPTGDADQMRQYLTGFWVERSASFPEAEARHRQYCERIAHVNEQYGACKYGQGSLTEMGNIYLRFGKPNTVVKRHHETDYYPYEIWHYHKAGRFNNKRFLFFAPHVVGECFELLHSDMLGERQNEDWLSQLRSRENTVQVSQSMENRLNPRDSFSGEEPEDLFFNPR